MQAALDALSPLEPDERARALRWLAAELDVEGVVPAGPTPPPAGGGAGGDGAGSGNPSLSSKTPRTFLAEKKPKTAVERMACLAFYSAHARGVTTFKAADLNALNIEAAAQKFTNPGRDFDNADRASGYLVDAGDGKKQLGIRGEALVDALPDRATVKTALAEHPHKRRGSGRRGRARASADGNADS